MEELRRRRQARPDRGCGGDDRHWGGYWEPRGEWGCAVYIHVVAG